MAWVLGCESSSASSSWAILSHQYCAHHHQDEGCVEHTMGHVLPYRIVRSWRRYICSVCLWQSKSRATDFPAGYWNSLPRRASHERSPISCLSLYAAFVRSKSTLRWRHAHCLVQRDDIWRVSAHTPLPSRWANNIQRKEGRKIVIYPLRRCDFTTPKNFCAQDSQGVRAQYPMLCLIEGWGDVGDHKFRDREVRLENIFSRFSLFRVCTRIWRVFRATPIACVCVWCRRRPFTMRWTLICYNCQRLVRASAVCCEFIRIVLIHKYNCFLEI